MTYLPQLFESGDYPTTINGLDDMARNKEGTELASILCNRALCYQKMDLARKALKNYDEALRADPNFSRAHMGKGKALCVLGKPREAQKSWQMLVDNFGPLDDLSMVEAALNFIRDPSLCLKPPMTHSHPPAQDPVVPPPKTGAASSIVRSSHPNGQQSSSKPVQKRVSSSEKQLLLSSAVELVNKGDLDKAIGILDTVIVGGSTAENVGPLITRGTARAMRRDLEGAIEDFTAGIEAYPQYGDTWKRRGQARSALGDLEGAQEDFGRAMELLSDETSRADIRAERGSLYIKQSQYYKAFKELTMATKLNANDVKVWHQLGSSRMCLGDFKECFEAFKKGLALNPESIEIWSALAQAYKEAAMPDEAEKAFKRALKLMPSDHDARHEVLQSYAHMKQGLGQHLKAVALLDQALQLSKSPAHIIETSYLRGACYHALGYYKNAVEDYTRAFMKNLAMPSPTTEPPKSIQQFQALAYLQRELAYYAYNHLDSVVSDFSMDQDIHPVFKELWSKRRAPTAEQAIMCQQKHRLLPIEAEEKDPPPLPDPEQASRILQRASQIGELVQNRHQGFLPNKRQQIMAGLAAIELAQTFLDLVEARKNGVALKGWLGASLGPQPHDFGWRDAMDIVVKWRQLSEPNDQVLWVDLLTKEEFEAGFGSHTPMFSGQSKCVRYYMNFERAVRMLKDIIAKDGKAYQANGDPIPLSESQLAALKQAGTVEKLWQAVGEDYWNVVPIQSSLNPTQVLEGTRLTVVKVQGIEDHYEVSIRTPVTPSRWKKYDEEFVAAWEDLVQAFLTGDKPEIAKKILTFVFYWYNFMPIARGTAVCGYITLLSLFDAADMPVTTPIPQNNQVDWEALLQQTPEAFMKSLEWLVQPALKAATPPTQSASSDTEAVEHATTAGPGSEQQPSEHSFKQNNAGPKTVKKASLKDLPSVKEFYPTLRNRLEALNGPGFQRL